MTVRAAQQRSSSDGWGLTCYATSSNSPRLTDVLKTVVEAQEFHQGPSPKPDVKAFAAFGFPEFLDDFAPCFSL